MTHLMHFFPLKDLEVVRGRNATLECSDGRAFLDVGGASHGAAIVGHSHPRVVAAVQDQVAQVSHVAHLYPNPAREAFLDALHAHLPDALTRTFLANSGTEAMEACIKFAAASTGRTRFVAATNGFHGRTLGALGVTHKPAYREPVAGLTLDCGFVPYNDTDALAAAVTSDTAGVVLEPVQGEGGVVPATAEYLRTARDLCDDHGARLILDEVQTGMGRTGPFTAASAHGIVPDLTALGKGLAGGLPVGAAVATDDVFEALPAGFHGSTYGAGPLVCAAGAAALGVWDEEDLGGRSARLGDRMLTALRAIDHPAIADVRGIGLMVNVDLTTPTGPVLQALQDAGFLALAGGARGIRFLPPLTIDAADLDRTVAAFAAALAA